VDVIGTLQSINPNLDVASQCDSMKTELFRKTHGNVRNV